MDKLRYSLTLGLALFLLCGSACATHSRPWQPRTVQGCGNSLGDAALDQERTFLATLLALSSRNYAIVHSEAPLMIEAESRSDYHPEIFHTRWVLRVQRDGALEVDAPTNARETHDKTELWYQKLSQSVAVLACRDPNWLRWEAQNRGLLAVGAGLSLAPVEGSAGGEQPAVADESASAQAPMSAPVFDAPPSPAERAQRQAELDRLRRARNDVHLFRTVAYAGVGVGFVGVGVGLGLQGMNQYLLCTDEGKDCVSLRFARVLGYTGLASAAVGGVFLAVSLPIMFGKLPRYKALSREMKSLRDPSLALGVGTDRTPFGLTLRGSF